MKLFQPGIFETPSICYNSALKKLQNLDAQAAVQMLDRYRGYTPDSNLDIEYAFADLLDDWTMRDAIESDPETAMDIWEQWCLENDIPALVRKTGRKEVFLKIRKALFRKISTCLLNQPGPNTDDMFLTEGRAVKCLMLGNMWDNGLKLSRQVLSHSGKPGKIMCYMGDCAFRLGMKETAREAYLQASLLAPSDMEIKAVQDNEVRELFTDPEYICDENDFPQGPWRQEINWAAALGMAAGIFPVIPVEAINPVIKLEDIFYQNSENRYTEGQAFAAGLILSFGKGHTHPEQGGEKAIRMITDIRRVTRDMAPGLFAIVLAGYADREHTPCGP